MSLSQLSYSAPGPVAVPGPAPVPARRPPAPRRDLERVIAELHERHEAELGRFCRWMLKDAEDAADAQQDTWIRAMTALRDDTIRVAAYRPWLFAIARNVCLDRLRDRGRSSLHELDEDAAGDTPGVHEVVEIRQEADAALALVGSLSERQRTALLMRELAGMSVAEIAEALGVTVQRAHWTIADARRSLEEARAGGGLQCEDARSRIGAGHRGRTLREHLARCPGCRSHDRSLRARRVLAPALVPFLWLRKLSWPLLSKPAAATMAAVAAAGAVQLAPTPDRGEAPRAVVTQPAVRGVAPVAAPVPAPRVAPARRQRAPQRPSRTVSAPRATPAVPPAPAVAPAPAPPVAGGVGESAPAHVTAPVREVAATVLSQARSTLEAAAEAVAPAPVAAAPAAPAVEKAAGLIDAIA